MEKKSFFIILHLLFYINMQAQVGVNTTEPKALLDIRALDSAHPENTVGFLAPRVEAFSTINPALTQQGMLVYLVHESESRNSHYYFWDNNNLRWDWFKDNITKEIDYNTSMVSGDKFYTSSGVASDLTTIANGSRYIRFNSESAAIADERNTIVNGSLRMGVAGEYLLVLTGGIQKRHTGISDYRSDVLVNGAVYSPQIASQINIPNIANRAGVFSTSQVLTLNKGDLLSIRSTLLTTGLTSPSAYVNSPFVLIITLLREL